jgi:hypothetical protein
MQEGLKFCPDGAGVGAALPGKGRERGNRACAERLEVKVALGCLAHPNR